MADGDGQLIGVREFFLESELPGAAAGAIAAAAIGEDEQFGRVGIAFATFPAPPLAKGFDREQWCVVGGAHDDHPAIGLEVVNAVGDGQTMGLRAEVMILDQNWRPTPHLTVVFELAHQLLFLGIHTDNRIAAAAELLPVVGEVAELLVAIWTVVGTKTFAVSAEGVIQLAQQTADGIWTHPQAQLS